MVDETQVVLTMEGHRPQEAYVVMWAIMDMDHSECIQSGTVVCAGSIPGLEGFRVALSAAWRNLKALHA